MQRRQQPRFANAVGLSHSLTNELTIASQLLRVSVSSAATGTLCSTTL